MSEISVLNFDKQEVNSLLAGTFGVPGVTADSSLADLSTNIGLIDTDQHPDYALPWIMADGSSGFVVPVTMGRNRGADVTVSLVPHPDNAGAIVMATMTGGAQWGLNQMTAGMRARYRMDASPGNTPDANNNYAGLNNVWSDSSCPYWHKMKFAVSHYDNDYRCSLYQAGSWTHAASSMSQASTSSFNSLPIAVFGSSYVYTNKVAMRPNGTNKYFASKGTMLYDLTFTTGTYDSSTIGDTYTPVLHWDRVYKKYRPCLYESVNGKYSSFAIGEGDNFPDDGRDGAYYIDTASGLTELDFSVTNETYSVKNIATDIQMSGSHTYIMRAFIGYGYQDSGNPVGKVMWTTNGSRNIEVGPYIARRVSPYSGQGVYGISIVDGTTENRIIEQTYTTDTGRSTYRRDELLVVNFGDSSKCGRMTSTTYIAPNANSYWKIGSLSISAHTVPDSSRGTLYFNIGNTQTSNNINTGGNNYRFYWTRILDENGVLIHYLVPCKKNSAYGLYDAITKKFYS